MGGKSGGESQVADYRLSMHIGICLKVDAVLALYYNEKQFWTGEVTTNQRVYVYQPELNGGQKKEGGLVGNVDFLIGGDTQTMPAELAAKVGRTEATCPAYRGITSLFFTAGLDSIFFKNNRPVSIPGFLWSCNNPYIGTVWATVRCSPKTTLTAGEAMIGPDANPSHIIMECLRDTDFGMGAPATAVDAASFDAAGHTLYLEQFGLSIGWFQQSMIEDFIKEVLDHIQATLFVNPTNGLLTLKLLRDDYDVEELQTLDVTNAVLNSHARKLWGETVNEIVVTWTNPLNEQEETVSYQDLANVAIQGAPVSASRNFYGVRNAELAGRLCVRELRASAAPLRIAEVDANRSAWKQLPGGVVKVNFPVEGDDLVNVMMRVAQVDYGKSTDGSVKISLIEDIFALSKPVAPLPPGTGWVDESEDPAPMAEAKVITMPRYMISATTTNDPDDLEYPEVYAGILAAQTGKDTNSYDLVTEVPQPNADPELDSVATRSVLGKAKITSILGQTDTTVITGDPLAATGRGPRINGFAVFGDDEGTMEIALISAVDGDTGAWTLKRGVLDTVPREWPAETPVWFLTAGSLIDDPIIRSVGEEVTYQLLSRTSRGLLAVEDAPEVTGTLTARPYLPLRPANVKFNGDAFVDHDASDGEDIEITWSTRNRLLEETNLLLWTDPSVPPEYLQRTVITIYLQDMTLLWRHEWLYTEESYTIPMEWLRGRDRVYITVGSARKGYVSHQSFGMWMEDLPAGVAVDPPVVEEPDEPDPPEPETPEPETPEYSDPLEPPPRWGRDHDETSFEDLFDGPGGLGDL